MLPQRRRLRQDRDFQRLFRASRPTRGRLLTVWAAPNSKDHDRIGIVVSGRVSKKAHVRNRIKRQLRHWFIPRSTPGWDIVVAVQPAAKETPLSILGPELTYLLNRAVHAPSRR